MARLLNQGVLPDGYYAVPLADRDGPVEIDVATLREASAPNPAVAPQPWVAPAPGLTFAIELPPAETVEVHVYHDDGEPRLMAAIELLSPRNKDRPSARQAFAVKSVNYLQQGSSVVTVDTVTTRRADVKEAIFSLLGIADHADRLKSSLLAVSYKAIVLDDESQHLEVWPAPLALGEPLPVLPLWIG